MRVILGISFLFLCIISSSTVSAVDFSKCTSAIDSIVEEYKSSKYYGGLNPFYSINKGIADGLQKTMSDEMITDIYNYIDGTPNHKSLGTIINDIVKSQAGAIAFFCVGLLLILVSLVLGFTICSCRCCCNSCGAEKNETTFPSVCGAIVMIGGLLTTFAFVLTGVIIFNLSSNNLDFAIRTSPTWIGNVYDNLNKVIVNGTDDMTCTVNVSVDATFTNLEAQMELFPQNLNEQFLDNTGIQQLLNFKFDDLTSAIDDAKDQNGIASTAVKAVAGDQNCEKQKKEVLDHLKNDENNLDNSKIAVGLTDQATQQTNKSVQDNLSNLDQTMNKTIAPTISTMQQVETDINDQMTRIRGSVNQTMQTIGNVKNAIDTANNDILTWSGYKPIRASWQAAMSIPNCICLFFSLATGIALVLWIFKGNDAPRGLGYVAISGFYFVIFLAWMSMAVASVTFVGGWAISGACKPMFEDKTFRVYGLVDGLAFTLQGFDGTQSNVTAKDLLLSCSRKDTLFKAIGGDSLISVDMVNAMLNLTGTQQILDGLINAYSFGYDFNPEAQTELNNSLDSLKQDQQYFKGTLLSDCASPDAQNAQNALKTLADKLSMVVDKIQPLVDIVAQVAASGTDPGQQKQKDLLSAYTNDQCNNATAMVNASVTELLNQLDTSTFPCYPLYQSFENTGTIMCDWLGRPVHGMWGAAGLAAIFFIPVAFIMLYASGTIFTGERRKRFTPADELPVNSSSVHRTKTTQDPWKEEETDVFSLPPIHSDQPPQGLPRANVDYYANQPTAMAAAPWLDDSYSKGSGLRRTDDHLQRSADFDSHSKGSGLRRTEDQGHFGGDDRWDSQSGSGLRRIDDDSMMNPSAERWSSTALRRM